MTRQELHTLVDTHFEKFEELQQEPSFLSFEQKFAQIWTQVGCHVLQATIGKAPENPKKKHVSDEVWNGRNRS